jgi:hypothetical protein
MSHAEGSMFGGADCNALLPDMFTLISNIAEY